MRNIYISLVVMISVLLPGTVVFRGSETGSQVVVLVAFFGSIALLHALDARQHRREGGE